MKLGQAMRRVTHMRIVSALIWLISGLFLLIGLLKGLYVVAESTSTTFPPVTMLNAWIKWGIDLLYTHTLFLLPIWRYAPTPAPYDWTASANYWVIFWAAAVAVGQSIWAAASNLNRRIKERIKRVEELGWERELMGGQGYVEGKKPDVLQINIDLDQKDQWYKRPIGLLGVGVAIIVLGQIALLTFGLVH
ncbi:YniB family protein [Burkholderia pseudomallei]|uniref:YniB family protein n=1 Tax=Burkholderia pseudomallei TaxID=28450 RepID=UPI00061B9E6D|nr:YniB family protein [Burkholderia pseudomallei]CPG86660.1 Uncharacterised protein [Burkholderia pseudomallei]